MIKNQKKATYQWNFKIQCKYIDWLIKSLLTTTVLIFLGQYPTKLATKSTYKYMHGFAS